MLGHALNCTRDYGINLIMIIGHFWTMTMIISHLWTIILLNLHIEYCRWNRKETEIYIIMREINSFEDYVHIKKINNMVEQVAREVAYNEAAYIRIFAYWTVYRISNIWRRAWHAFCWYAMCWRKCHWNEIWITWNRTFIKNQVNICGCIIIFKIWYNAVNIVVDLCRDTNWRMELVENERDLMEQAGCHYLGKVFHVAATIHRTARRMQSCQASSAVDWK